MMGPPGSLARDVGTNSLKTNSVRGGRAAAAATPEAAFRKNFRRVVGIGTSLFVCGALLIAEKGARGQQSDSSGGGAVSGDGIIQGPSRHLPTRMQRLLASGAMHALVRYFANALLALPDLSLSSVFWV
jgi:hypothetical protein